MNHMKLGSRLLPLTMAMCFAGVPLPTGAEDIDIFVSNVNNVGVQGLPNVLIILDNTSNWSRSEGFSPVPEQGKIEVTAIKNVLAGLTNVNVGLMLANDIQGNADPGAFVHYGLKFMEAAAAAGNNKYALNQRLDAIYNNLGTNEWKGPSSLSYGGMMFDAFKYFGGYTSPAHAVDDVAGTPTSATRFGPIAYQGGNTPSGRAPGTSFPMLDPAAYSVPSPITENMRSYPGLTFNPPGTAAGVACGANNYIIFISNKRPNNDSNATTDLLASVGSFGGGSALTPRVPRPAVLLTQKNGVNRYIPDPAGGSTVPANSDAWYMPEWARFLRKTDVSALPGQQNVVTYTINVYHGSDNVQQQYEFSRMLMATATAGGGKYFTVTEQAELDVSLNIIFSEIQATSSTFASATLPISATNRALNANQVYIGMFRPDQTRQPRWFGNLKRYQLIRSGSGIRLGDALGADAVNNNTGFVTDCAASYWSTDSGTYWANVPLTPQPRGTCTIDTLDPTTGTVIAHDEFSDYPDGPLVEKGAVAEVLRKRTTARVITTSTSVGATDIVDFNTANTALTAAGLTVNDIKYTMGQDLNDENADASITDTRPSVHGDVVHGRPLAVTYGAGAGGTVIYYGANDGLLRAVDADSGAEKWAYVAPEFYPSGAAVQPLARLYTNSPAINYSGGTDPTARPKNYFFDGGIGLYQTSNNDKVWIYPTMRRGGRMVYALDVTGSSTAPPAVPAILWKFGCPNLTNDSGCIPAAASAIGQTWSLPSAARVNTSGLADASFTRVVIMGGGYDNCEDANQINPPCSGAKGNRVFVLDAEQGTILKEFTTDGRVPSDVALLDIDFDGIVDYAYVGDTAGNLYRIAFGPSKTLPLLPSAWTMVKVAATAANSGRKFLHAPAVVSYYSPASAKTYVYVTLGSGDREKPLESQYPYQSDVKNRFYMFLDDLSVAAPATTNLDTALLDLSTDPFSPQQTDCSAGVVPGTTQMVPGTTTSFDTKGWFIQYSNGTGNAANQGEQTVSSSVIVGGQVAFSTNRPIHATATSCAPTGEARGYFVNLFNASGTIGSPGNLACGGGRSDVFTNGALPPSPVLADVVIDGIPATVIIGAVDKSGGASSIIGGQEGFFLPPQKRTRPYWKEDIDN